MKAVEVTIKGITPQLMHRFPGGKPEGKADEPSTLRTGVPDWKAEAEVSLYKDKKGKLYQPAEHIERSFAEAAKNYKIPGRRGATFSKLASATVDVFPDVLIHKIQHYEIDERPVVVGKARVIRYRPRLDEWELDFTLRLHDDQLPLAVAKQILDYAGLYCGIGDYRPQKRGKYGKFMVTKFEEVKEK